MHYVCGDTLYAELLQTRHRIEQSVIGDPVVTRLWLLILFLSPRLHCHYDSSRRDAVSEPMPATLRLQHSYLHLLMNYLIYRHTHVGAVRILINLNGIFLRIQRVSEAIDRQIRVRKDLFGLHDALDCLVSVDRCRGPNICNQ